METAVGDKYYGLQQAEIFLSRIKNSPNTKDFKNPLNFYKTGKEGVLKYNNKPETRGQASNGIQEIMQKDESVSQRVSRRRVDV